MGLLCNRDCLAICPLVCHLYICLRNLFTDETHPLQRTCYPGGMGVQELWQRRGPNRLSCVSDFPTLRLVQGPDETLPR